MGGTTVWLWWFTGLPQGSLLFPWIRVRAKLTKFGILAALNILGLPFRTLRSWAPIGSNPCTMRSLRPSVLVRLLVVFRDKGLGVPNIALLLDFFSVKEAAERFLYISERSSAKLIISDLPSSHKFWKDRYFFVSGRHWEYNPFDREDTLSVPVVWTTPENLRDLSFILICFGFQRS